MWTEKNKLFPKTPLTLGLAMIHKLERLADHIAVEFDLYARREDMECRLAQREVRNKELDIKQQII